MAQVYPSHQLLIGALSVEVTAKPIKHLHLSVVPPCGAVRISAPEGMSADHVRAYAIGKLAWIRRQQARFQKQQRESPRLVVERESHHLWGSRLLLEIRNVKAAPKVAVHPRKLVLFVRPGSTAEKRQTILAGWYRSELRKEATILIDKWQQRLNVQANKLFIQAMTRQWGSCNPASGNIRLNTQLAQKPKECLDYVVLHELAHLRVPSHGEEFIALLDNHLPEWEERRRLLNTLPLLCS
ncbi:M48 family metallopeptidase [Synechococcus sp. CS-1328]|uniref:M48 family metallopeptidase n=1 Tax=Synechococcus sp. CS-1328 TaxID=2847976 RepID=UPI00223AE362|nr:SprT family zinc-dependent metalloprotease [Synechococcus sp. CS-1328]MCT0224756.1 M48 family metallopeptidase [Synechococcus sp. CS-1328]